MMIYVMVNDEPELGIGEVFDRYHSTDGEEFLCIKFRNRDIGYYTKSSLVVIDPSSSMLDLQLQLV